MLGRVVIWTTGGGKGFPLLLAIAVSTGIGAVTSAASFVGGMLTERKKNEKEKRKKRKKQQHKKNRIS